MNIFSHSSSSMDIDDPTYCRWSYAISDARSEPITIHKAISKTRKRQPSLPSPPLPSVVPPPSPIQTSPGVWEDENGVYYSSSWYPVQEYLDLIRRERMMMLAPSEIIFVLAALDVVHSPWDVAHWIFWPSATYYKTADRVTAIARMCSPFLHVSQCFWYSLIVVHQPRLIITKVPWIGSREYRWIVNAIQEKYYYVHVLGKWYPTDFQPIETKKRTLRSNAGGEDRSDMTINQFFNIVEQGASPLKRLRKLSRKVIEPQSLGDKRPRGIAHQNIIPPTAPTVAFVDRSADKDKVVDESSSRIPRSSGRVKRKMSPPTQTRVLTATNSDAELPSTSTIDILLSSSHARNRSTSQSSEQTIVADDNDSPTRSSSVESTMTAIGTSLPSKKRKLEILDGVLDTSEDTDLRPPSPKRMTTRNRSRRIARTPKKPIVKGAEFSVFPSESQAKPTQAKGNLKKWRPLLHPLIEWRILHRSLIFILHLCISPITSLIPWLNGVSFLYFQTVLY